MSQTKKLSHWNSSILSEGEVLEKLKATPTLHNRYSQMDKEWRKRFMDFCCGKKTLPLTYDPFFKRIFHPDIHPERLSRLITSLLGIKVKVKGVLPSEDSMMDGESLLILDILVELEDGSLSNIEVQKCPYAFPAERMSCYSSDLIMRQYTRAKGQKGKDFTYQDVKKVYTIVLFEKSTETFHEIPQEYIHYGRTTFNTGLKLELLQEYCLIALDVFRDFPYPKNRSEQTAWLSLLVTESVEEADKLIKEYPWLVEIYQEAAALRKNPEEVLGMYSEALRILDRNTVRYMIEQQQKEIEQQQKEIERQKQELKKKDLIIQEAIQEKDTALQEKDTALQEKDLIIRKKNSSLEQKDKELEELKQQLEQLRQKKGG